MSEESLYKNLGRLGDGIETCLEKNHAAPALILLYSAIDTVGWLDSDQEFATRSSFINWVERYLLTAAPLSPTALDLYAARCGLLHTFTPDSKLTTQGQARRACYAWGNASVQDLQRTLNLTGRNSEFYAIHLNDLYSAWGLGLLAFTRELESDPARKLRVCEKAGQFFRDLGTQPVQDLLHAADQSQEGGQRG